MANTSENGWAFIRPNQVVRRVIPGTTIVLPGNPHAAGFVLNAFAGRYNAVVEPLAGGASDEGAYTENNSVFTSNHKSGTAYDLNWNRYPFRRYTMSKELVARVKGIQREFEFLIDWGRDCWGGNPIDEMHYQVAKGKPMQAYVDFANRLREGHLGIFGGAAPGVITKPDANGVGPGDLLMRGVSGVRVTELQKRLNRDYPRYSQLAEDGEFGPGTEAVVREFQRRSGLLVDGVVGPATRQKLGL